MSDKNDSPTGDYAVEQIVDKRERDGVTEYLVKWLSYDSTQNTWVRAEKCNCPALIVEYEDLRKSEERKNMDKDKGTGPTAKSTNTADSSKKSGQVVKTAVAHALTEKIKEVDRLREERRLEKLDEERLQTLEDNRQQELNILDPPGAMGLDYQPLFPNMGIFNPTVTAPATTRADTRTRTASAATTSANTPAGNSNRPFSSLPDTEAYAIAIYELKSENAELKIQISQILTLMDEFLDKERNSRHFASNPERFPVTQQQQRGPPQTQPVQFIDRQRVPLFSRDNVETWFFQLETLFNRRNISNDDSAKYDTLVTAVDTNVLTQVSGTLRNAPPGNKYEMLKKAIITNYADSETQALRKLLSGIPLGTMKPTALLNKMRNTAKSPNAEQSGLIRHFWLDQLPPEVRAIIIANKSINPLPASVTLDTEATLADAIMDSLDTKPESPTITSTVSAVSTDNSVQIAIDDLTKKVEALFKRGNSPRRYRMRSSSRSGSKDRTSKEENQSRRSSSTSTTCSFHRRFGMAARNCTPPCNFHSKPDDQSKNS